MKPIIRWMLLAPITVASWFIVLYIGAILYYFIFHCARTGFVYGTCMFGNGQGIFITTFAALSAIIVIIMAAVIAPDHKLKVAWLTFALGAVMAAITGKLESYVAISAGFVCVLVISIYRHNQIPNKSTVRTPHNDIRGQSKSCCKGQGES